MIDRGDLSAEIGIENLFQAIIKIAHETKMAGIPLIMATENLSSMLINQQPSKSDVISLSHSIQIGTDAIMLSDETAMSVQYEPILDWLSTFYQKKQSIFVCLQASWSYCCRGLNVVLNIEFTQRLALYFNL